MNSIIFNLLYSLLIEATLNACLMPIQMLGVDLLRFVSMDPFSYGQTWKIKTEMSLLKKKIFILSQTNSFQSIKSTHNISDQLKSDAYMHR